MLSANSSARPRCQSDTMTAPNRFYQREQKLRGSAYYICRRDRPTFFIFAVGPGRKITTSFPRSNPEWRRRSHGGVRRRVRLSFLAVCMRYIRRRVRVLEEIYNGTRARKASRRWASCVTSSAVGMRKYTSCEARKSERETGEGEGRRRARQTCAPYTRPP